jgi:hypothetical protein
MIRLELLSKLSINTDAQESEFARAAAVLCWSDEMGVS